MNKLSKILPISLFLLVTQVAYAADPDVGTINPPPVISRYATGSEGLSNFFTVGAAIFMAIAAVIFLFMIIWAGIQWTMSGGNKEELAKARSRIINAIIGLTIIALAFFITRVVREILHI